MNTNSKKESKLPKRRWAQWSLMSVLFLALVVSILIIPFVNRAEHVRFWQEVYDSNLLEIEMESGQPTNLASRLRIPSLLKSAFPDVAANYYDSVKSVSFEEPAPELQAKIAERLGPCNNLLHLNWPGEVHARMARDLGGCESLSLLKLSQCQDTDALLASIVRLKQLQVITFNNCSISKQGLANLAKMKQLKLLLMHETEVSQQAVEELRASLPGCYVMAFVKKRDIPIQ